MLTFCYDTSQRSVIIGKKLPHSFYVHILYSDSSNYQYSYIPWNVSCWWKCSHIYTDKTITSCYVANFMKIHLWNVYASFFNIYIFIKQWTRDKLKKHDPSLSTKIKCPADKCYHEAAKSRHTSPCAPRACKNRINT